MIEVNKCWLVSVVAGLPIMRSIKAAKAAGILVFATDGDPDAPGFKINDHHKVVDIKDPESVVDAVKVSGIVTLGVISFVSDEGIQASSFLREYYRLPGPNVEQSLALTNKLVQKRDYSDKEFHVHNG